MNVHVVIKGVLHQYGPDFFKDISGCVVVEHAIGLVQKERPHYHIWYPGVSDEDSTRRSLRNYYDTKNKELKWNTHANAYYTVKKHDDFEAWLHYTWYNADCKLPALLVWNLPGERPVRLMDELILPAPSGSDGIALTGVTTSAVAVASQPPKEKRKEACYLKFYKYCKDSLVGPNDKPTLDDIVELWIAFTCGNYELRNVSAPVRYAWYMLNDKEERIKNKMINEIKTKLFSDY